MPRSGSCLRPGAAWCPLSTLLPVVRSGKISSIHVSSAGDGTSHAMLDQGSRRGLRTTPSLSIYEGVFLFSRSSRNLGSKWEILRQKVQNTICFLSPDHWVRARGGNVRNRLAAFFSEQRSIVVDRAWRFSPHPSPFASIHFLPQNEPALHVMQRAESDSTRKITTWRESSQLKRIFLVYM